MKWPWSKIPPTEAEGVEIAAQRDADMYEMHYRRRQYEDAHRRAVYARTCQLLQERGLPTELAAPPAPGALSKS